MKNFIEKTLNDYKNIIVETSDKSFNITFDQEGFFEVNKKRLYSSLSFIREEEIIKISAMKENIEVDFILENI